MRIILASGSPRRKAILSKLGYNFDVINPTVKETTSKKLPHKIVQDLAFKKAFSVAVMYPDAIVIGGDTLVYCKGKILGKPKDKKDALKLLKIENNSWQAVYSGLAIICKNKKKLSLGYDKTLCKARNLDLKTLKNLASKNLDKAGAYAMQDKDDCFIKQIKGSYDNVVGFPSELFKKMIKEFL